MRPFRNSFSTKIVFYKRKIASKSAGSRRARAQLHRGVRSAIGHAVQKMEARRGLRGAGHIVQGRLRAEWSRERSHMHLGPDHRELPVDAGRPRGPGHQSPIGPYWRRVRVAGHAHPGQDDQTVERHHRYSTHPPRVLFGVNRFRRVSIVCPSRIWVVQVNVVGIETTFAGNVLAYVLFTAKKKKKSFADHFYNASCSKFPFSTSSRRLPGIYRDRYFV